MLVWHRWPQFFRHGVTLSSAIDERRRLDYLHRMISRAVASAEPRAAATPSMEDRLAHVLLGLGEQFRKRDTESLGNPGNIVEGDVGLAALD